jgi:uncharacterized zinc-type alcohol dehydrogenase-like protein
MPQTVKSYAAHAADQPLAPLEIERRDLRANDVSIAIDFCGVCHTDLHFARNHWGRSRYPLVPGHEIVGTIAAVGPAANRFQVGDRVAVGCMVDACLSCPACSDHEEQYCHNGATQTYGDKDRVDGSNTQGGYSRVIVVREEFVLRVPEGLDPASAAPLLCAGITTYSPLNYHQVGPGMHVGVIGLGGLGHMAIKFAAAMGAEVTLFTTSESKIPEAKRLGAHHVVLSTEPDQMQATQRQLDLIIDTVPEPHPMASYLQCMARNGNIVLVGPVGLLEPPIHTGMLLSGRKAISGSAIGGIAETQAMLDFCAEKGVTCDIEMIRMDEIDTAYQRMENNDVRYRFVIDMSTLQ